MKATALLFAAVFFCAVVASDLCFGQRGDRVAADAGITQTPSVSGRVVDAAGGPVPGAFVTITEESGNRSTRATTGRDGTYEFVALPDGTYRIDFGLTGFDRMRRNRLPVRSGATAVVGDVTLFASSECECVDVFRPAVTLRERPGLVTDESGRPLALARLQLATPGLTRLGYTDSEGRFRVRVPSMISGP